MQTQTTPATANMVLVVNRQGETVRVGNGRVLVASKTHQGVMYDVTGGTCQCPGFIFRGRCRHLAANPNRPEPPTPSAPAMPAPMSREPLMPTPASCPRCQRPTADRDASPIAKLGQCARCVNEMLYGPDEVA